jgi:hypothetical protein
MNRAESFSIESQPNLKLIFDQPKHNNDGWLESYQVSVISPGLTAKIRAENPPYGHSPVKLFEQMANDWDGWDGEKSWGAMEGEYNLVATSSKTGHITLSAELEIYNTWSTTAHVDIEAGQLETIAKKAKRFFGC